MATATDRTPRMPARTASVLASTPAARGVAFLCWLLLALCACFWGLRFVPGPTTADAPPVSYAPPEPADPVALARVFGPAPVVETPVAAAPQVPSDNLVLQGVVAGRTAQGFALIAVNGKPARPYRVGGRIEDRYVLQSVAARSAVLAHAEDLNTRITLDLAPPAASQAPAAAVAPAGTNQGVAAPTPTAPPSSGGAPAGLRPRLGPQPGIPQRSS